MDLFYIVLIGFLFSDSGRSIIKSLRFYFNLMFPNRRWRLISLFSPLIREEVSFYAKGRLLKPDIYRPQTRNQLPVVILYCPLATEGKNHPQVINFMKGFAKLGFTVIAPYCPARRHGEIYEDDVEELKATIRFLEKQPYVDKQRISLIAISYGLIPSLELLSQSKWQSKIKHLTVIGGVMDFHALGRFGLTHKFFWGEIHGRHKPDVYLTFILLRTLAKFLPAKDQVALNNWLDQQDPLRSLDFKQARSSVSKVSRKIIDQVFRHHDLTIFKRSNLPSLDHMQSLAGKITIPTLIFHSTKDHLVPFTESLKLYDASDHTKATLYLVNSFEHTIPKKPTLVTIMRMYLPSIWPTLRFIHGIIRYSS